MENIYKKNKTSASINWVIVMVMCVAAFFTTTTFAQAPPAPVATSATNYTCTSFNANWDPVSGGTAYFLDVSTDVNFSTFVSSYNNINVGNTLTFNVTGLTANTNYYYRVRVTDGTNTSLNSNIILVNSGAVSAPNALPPASVSCTSFNANWSAVAGATSYSLDVSTSANFVTFQTGLTNLNVGNVTTYNVNGLTANSTYYYRLRATNGCGTSVNSNVIAVLTGAPTAPTAMPPNNFTCSSVNANWSYSNGATSYYLDISTSQVFATFISGYNNTNVGNANTYNVTGLNPNTTYYYRVRAANGCATSLNSNTESFNTFSTTTPTALAASNIACATTVANWNSSPNATMYSLDVSTDINFGSFISGYNNFLITNDTSHTIIGLSPNTTYYYCVRASNGGCGYSLNSDTISFTTTATANPNASTATAATNVNCTSLTANWTAVTGALAYFIDVSTAVSFSTFITSYNNLNVGNVTSYTLNGLTANTTYYYRVRVQDGCGISLNSNTISINSSTTDAPIALNPPFLTCTSFDASWQATSGALSYTLDVSTDALFSNFVTGYNNLNVGNVTTYPVTGLTVNVTYHYRVRAFSSCNTSASSNVIAVSTNAPAAPVALAPSSITCSSFNANWLAVNAALTYYLDVSDDFAFAPGTYLPGYNNRNLGNVTTHNVTGIMPGITYYYRVRVDNACAVSSSSNSITIAPSNVATLISTLTPPAICSGTAFSYTPTSATPGATFAWTRASVSGISNATGSGTGNPNETLINTTANAVNVSYVYTVSANGCTNPNTYSVVVTVNPSPTLSSVLFAPDVYTGDAFTYTPTSATTGTTFSWTRAVVAGISNPAGSGTMGISENLINGTNFPLVVEYLYTLTANGCSNSTPDTVRVKVLPIVVWPGDANNDMVVNNFDLLPLGVHFSQTGTPRASTGNVWQAYISTNWGSTQNNGEDLMHVDCDGNGIIDNDDTLAINQNFSLTHMISNPPTEVYSNERTTPDMYFVISSSAFNAGDWVTAELWLGSMAAPLTNLYGLAFNIHYDQNLVENATEMLSYPTSWLGTKGTDLLTVSKIDNITNTACGAMVRNDQTPRSGYGKIADFKFQVSNSLTSDDTIMFTISSYLAIDSTGSMQTLTVGADTIAVAPLGTGIVNRKTENTISIAPNPFSTNTTITFNTEVQNATVKVFDVIGKEVKTLHFTGKEFTLEKGDLNAGIYSVKIISANQSVIANQKIVIR
ncbi:MAG: T9SS type A sorting domain-containing protein [Bacteroidia bacterium]